MDTVKNYALKRSFANSFDPVKLFHLTPPLGERHQASNRRGLVSLCPREEKNGYNSTIQEEAEMCRKHPKNDLVKSKNPYIVFIFYKRQKLVMYVGAKSAPHIH